MCTVCWWVACAFLLSNCRPPSQAATSLPRSEPIGSVTREKERVEVGINPGALQVVVVSLPLFVGDLLRVSQGGQAILDFHDNLKLRLFNDTKLTLEALTESEGVPLQARLFLEDKGLTGELLAKNGWAEFTTPTGVKVAVLGTRFFIVYDPDKRLTTVGNFHGLVGVGTGVGSVAFLQPGYYLDAYENQPPGPQLPIPVTDVQFEAWASDNRSSIVAVDLLRIATPVVMVTPSPSPPVTVPVTTTVVPTATATTPAPIPILTGTVIPDTGPTPAPPPGSPTARVIRNAQCRTGPGSVFSPVAGLLPGMSLPIVGRLYDSSWWLVRLAAQRANCWVWDRNVEVSDGSGAPVVGDPPPAPIPAGPSGVNACTREIALSWSLVNDVSGILRYEWELADSSGRMTNSGQTEGASVVVPVTCGGEAGNQSYTWRVRAVNGAGLAGGFSDRMNFEIQPAGLLPVLPVPVPVSPSKQIECAGSVTLSWSVKPDSRIDHYEWVLRDPRGEGSSRGEAKETSADVTVKCGSLGNPQPYTWLVRSVDGAGNVSQYSTSLDFSVLPDILPPPPPVQNRPAGQIDCTNSVTLSWSPVSDPSGIKEYEWKLGDPVEGAPSGKTAITSAVVDVSCGTKAGPRSYRWAVRAVDGAGNTGEYSADTFFAVLAPDNQRTRPPQIDTVTLSPASVCAGSEVVNVSARVLSDNAIQAVSLSWAVNQDAYTLRPMTLADSTQGGGFYRAEAGPARLAGLMLLRITAIDSLQQGTTVDYTVDVVDCQPATASPSTAAPATAVPTETSIPAQAP